MKKQYLLPFLFILSLLISGCSGSKDEVVLAKSGFSSNVYMSGFPANRAISDGFDHAAFDASIIRSVLGPVNAAPAETSSSSSSAVDTENHLISPANLYLSLSSLAYMTDGTTRFQLMKLLGPSKLSELEENLQMLWGSQFYQTSDAACLMGSSLWINDTLPVPEEKLSELSEKYYTASYVGQPSNKKFNESYRSWLSSMSAGLLDDQIGETGLDPDMALQSATSLFYKAQFSQSFEASQTYEQTFHTPTTDVYVQMMHMDESFPYHQDALFDAAGLPMKNGATLWLLLPKEGTTPAALAADQAVLNWLNAPSYDQEDLTLSVPRFDIIAQLSLIDSLKAIGVDEIFNAKKADFSGLSKEIQDCAVSRIDQTLRVRVFEGGVEASAFAETVVVSSAAPEDAVVFRLNRPFMFALRDYDGTILFAGIVNDPSK
ncbi:MAG: hypothetical protein J6P72_03755 [Firmicutes bacterium]|nr:hypothetical protein [Bacillota bacterium]